MAHKKKKTAPACQPAPKNHKRLFVGLGLLSVLLIVGIIAAILLWQQGKKNDSETKDTSRPAPTTTISIIYPVIQDNGQIVYTNALIETTQSDLYGALEHTLSDKIKFTYDETGGLLTAGRLHPQKDEKLVIKQNTSREQIDLGTVPAGVSLEDGATYEIMLADAKGDPVYKTAEPKEKQ